jgi:glycosyltransferase involved in cell wall biosynthesis
VLDPSFRRTEAAPQNSFPLRFAYLLRFLLDVVWYIWQCWRAIRRHRPAIVHALLTGVYLSLPAILLHPKVGYVLSAYSYQFVSYRDKHIFGINVGASLKHYAMRRCQRIDALSLSIRDDLVARGLPVEKISISPCSFTNVAQCQPAAVKEPWVVFLGRFVDIKNPLLLVEAMPKVIRVHPDVHFYFLGAGYLQAKIENSLNSFEVAANATVQFEPNPTQILNRSSIFVSLQSEENYPSQSLLEAMACGNAVVATDVGETWRLVDDANGARVQSTPTHVAEAIVQLLDAPQKLAHCQQVSRQRVLAEHTAARYFEYITGVYRAAADRIVKSLNR